MTIRYLSPDGEPSDVARYQESRLRSGPSVSAYDPRHAQSQVGPEDLAFWFTAPLRTELSRTTDCSVLMAYDQHNGTGLRARWRHLDGWRRCWSMRSGTLTRPSWSWACLSTVVSGSRGI